MTSIYTRWHDWQRRAGISGQHYRVLFARLNRSPAADREWYRPVQIIEKPTTTRRYTAAEVRSLLMAIHDRLKQKQSECEEEARERVSKRWLGSPDWSAGKADSYLECQIDLLDALDKLEK